MFCLGGYIMHYISKFQRCGHDNYFVIGKKARGNNFGENNIGFQSGIHNISVPYQAGYILHSPSRLHLS